MDVRKWTDQIDKTTADFNRAFGSLTPVQLNWKPASKTWSIAQNIDHLIVINEYYFPVMQSIRNGQYTLPFIARFPFMVSFLGKAVLKAVQPDRKWKMKTFPIWEPSAKEIGPDILSRFERHQQELKRLIENSQDLLMKGTIVSSPPIRNIVYTLETAFDIIVTHERRHLEQAREIAKLLP